MADGLVRPDDVDGIYEVVFLKAMTSFEDFLENLFVGLLIEGGGYECLADGFNPRVTVRSHAVAREVIAGSGREYIDWLPYRRLKEHAETFFTGGRPFTSLDASHKDALQDCLWIRNAIAHESRTAISKFKRFVLTGLTLAPRERTPGGYLRSRLTLSPPLTRLEFHATELTKIARKLTEK